jgi:FKBP-type peptidyl-prolyl cis-trans isomerase
MSRLFIFFSGVVVLFSCEMQGVETNGDSNDSVDSLLFLDGTHPQKTSDSLRNEKQGLDTIAVSEVSFDNGIRIKWFERGDGAQLKKNDLVAIDYRNQLEDGTVYDGNHLVKKAYIPFFLGWKQQTSGWDFALQKLRVGDEVEIFIPSEMARGEKGIPGRVPPNSNNILLLKVVKVLEPDFKEDDIRIWIVDKTKEGRTKIGYESEVSIHYWVSSESKPRYDNSYKRKLPFELKMGDGNIVPGLYKALLKGKKGDKMMVHIPAVEAYGVNGLPGLVPKNEDIFYDLIVLDVN